MQAANTLFEALQENTTVSLLKMEDCLLIDESADPFIEMVKKNRHLTNINLADNFISSPVTTKIISAIKDNRTITDFAPWDEYMDGTARSELHGILQQHKQWQRNKAIAAVQVLTSARVLLLVSSRACLSWPHSFMHLTHF